MKLHDWRARLARAVIAFEAKPFERGVTDCCSFAAACVEAQTGADHFAGFRGRYSDAAGAARAIVRAGFKDLAELLASMFPEIPPAYAAVGDLALLTVDGDWALGVFIGERIAIVRTDIGYTTLDRSVAERALRVS